MIYLAQDAPFGAVELTIRTHERLAQMIMGNTPNVFLTAGGLTLNLLSCNPTPGPNPHYYRVLLASKLPIALVKDTVFTPTINGSLGPTLNQIELDQTLTLSDVIVDDLESTGGNDLTSDILAYYRFENDLLDSSGNNYHLTEVGTISDYSLSDPPASGVYSVGLTTQYANISANMGDNSGNFTYAFWVKPSESFTYSFALTVVKPDGNEKIYVSQEEDFIGVYSDQAGIALEEFFSLSDIWYHVVYTKNGTTQEGRLYINGVLVGNQTMTEVNSGLEGLVLGANVFGNSIVARFAQLIVYNRTLTDSEVSELYSLGGAPPLPYTKGVTSTLLLDSDITEEVLLPTYNDEYFSDHTYIVPVTGNYAITVVGNGGAGGNGSAPDLGAGGGGAGGHITVQEWPLQAGNILSILFHEYTNSITVSSPLSGGSLIAYHGEVGVNGDFGGNGGAAGGTINGTIYSALTYGTSGSSTWASSNPGYNGGNGGDSQYGVTSISQGGVYPDGSASPASMGYGMGGGGGAGGVGLGAMGVQGVVSIVRPIAHIYTGHTNYWPCIDNVDDYKGTNNFQVEDDPEVEFEAHAPTWTDPVYLFMKPVAKFDGSVTLVNNDIRNTIVLTVAMWVRPKNSSPNAIVFQATGVMGYYYLGINSTSEEVSLESESGTISNTSAINEDTWYHIAFVMNGESIRLFMNGGLVANAPQTPNLTEVARMRLGSNTVGEFLNFEGYIGQVNMWLRGLSDSEIGTLYQRGGFVNGTSMINTLTRFYGGRGDAFGAPHLGYSLVGSPTVYLNEGPANYAAKLVNTELTRTGFNYTDGGSFSVGGFFKAFAPQTSLNILTLVYQGDEELILTIELGAAITFTLGSNNLTDAFDVQSDYYYVVLTGTGTTFKLYLDGVEVASGTWTLPSNKNIKTIILGSATSNMSFFNVGFWERALSQGEITDLYLLNGDPFHTV